MKTKWSMILVLVAVVVLLGAAILPQGTALALDGRTSPNSININGDLGDWAGDEFIGVDGGASLYVTWDATNLYLGLDMPYFLGDGGTDKSFFVAFDTDLVAGSGAPSDGYSVVNFGFTYRPEVIYYFAGGAGWYEWAAWNGSGWDWKGWSNAGTYYDWSGNPAVDPGDEFTIPWANLGNPSSMVLFAWLTPENHGDGVEASWPPANPVGSHPVFNFGYHFVSLGDGIAPNTAKLVPGVETVRINEIRIDQTGTDYDEYFELVGLPGMPLDGLTYIVIGDGTGGSGVIEAVVNLNGQVIPADGYFLAAEATLTLPATPDMVLAGGEPGGLIFENSDNVTHLIVKNFTGANGNDLDTNDDGVLDLTPWAAIVDLIAVIRSQNPPSGTEYHYGPPTVGPDGSFAPGHVYYCSIGWQIGPFNVVGGKDTPGAPNTYCPSVGEGIMVEKTGPAQVNIGENIIYTITVANKSDFNSVVTLTDTLPAGTTYIADDSGLLPVVAGQVVAWNLGTLNAHITKTIELTVSTAATLADGTILANQVEIATDLAGDPMQDNTDTWETTAMGTYGLELGLADQSHVGLPNEVVTYTLTVTNTSVGVTDTFSISVSGQVYPTTLDKTTVGPLAPGASETFHVMVHIPAGALFNDTDTVTVLVQFAGKPAEQKSLQIKTDVGAVYAFTVKATPNAAEVMVGTSFTYTLEVENTGNAPDVYTFTTMTLADFPFVFPANQIPLNPGQKATILVVVTAPTSAPDGALDQLTITTYSANGAHWAQKVLTTTAKWYKLFLPLVFKS